MIVLSVVGSTAALRVSSRPARRDILGAAAAPSTAALRLSSRPARRDVLGAVAALLALPPSEANAKYGEFANMDASRSDFSAGDKDNACLFAQPGTGVCMVYKSSDPPLWASPDQGVAFGKLLKAAEGLSGLGRQIEGGKWSSISQALGASRDLREATGFLTVDNPAAAKLAKAVFLDLDGVQLATQKKNAAAAKSFAAKYEADMSRLLAELEAPR